MKGNVAVIAVKIKSLFLGMSYRKTDNTKFRSLTSSDFEKLDTKLTATVLVNVCEPSEAYKFLDDFFAQSSTTFNKDKANRLNEY